MRAVKSLCYNPAMKHTDKKTGLADKALLTGLILASSLGFCLLSQPVSAQEEDEGGGGINILVGPQLELTYFRGPNYPTDPNDSRTGLILGGYIGTSGLEARPSVLISEGQYKGFLLDLGLRVTPKWFGQEEYLFNLVSPYIVLGGSIGYPWSAGWNIKGGLGVILFDIGSLNAEIGYRSHRLDSNLQAEGLTIGLRGTIPI